MKTKRILIAGAALLAVTMSMTACGQNTPAAATTAAAATAAQAETTTTTAAVTEKAETSAADSGSSENAYTVIVVDEAGNPVQGAAVQFCSDEQCLFQKTGADGIATFTEPEGKYTVHMLKVPDGFEDDKTEYDVPETYGTVTITLKAGSVSASESAAETAYTIVVVDEAGDPVEGAAVQFCSDEQCLFQKTGADGIATFTEPEGKYTVHMLKVPEGYAEDKTEYDVPETYGTVTITLKADNGGADETAFDADSPYANTELGISYTPGAEVEGLKGGFSAGGMLINQDSNPRTGFYSIDYYAFDPSYQAEYMDYYHAYATAMGKGEEPPEAPHEGWENPMGIQAPIVQIIVTDGDGEFDPGTLSAGLELSQLTLLAEEGKTKFYLYPIEMTGAGMDDIYKEAMGEYYDEFMALKENYEAVLANITYQEAERPRDEGMAALESLIFEGTDLDGNAVNTADLFADHKVTMVNFWATWCNPCIGELPELERMSKEFEEKGCQIVGICIDAYTDDVVATAKEILANAGVDYTNLRGWESILDEIPTSGYPTTYYVDSEGKIIGNRLTGAAITKYESELDNALSLVG